MGFRIQDHSARLQATRGIAALCVTLGHCFTTMINGRMEDAQFHLSAGNAVLAAGQLVFQPNTAVIFFYVLSGLVLGESWRRRPEFTGFAIRRLWRLLPVMWLSIAFALVVLAVVPQPPFQGATGWFNAFFGRAVSVREIVSDLAGLSWNVNSVLWSVQIELAMILLLPMLMYVSSRLSAVFNIVGFAVLAMLSLRLWGKLPGWANALLYLYCFYAGIVLPQMLRDARLAQLLANGWLTLATLPALLAVDFLYNTNRLWLPYKFIADALISTQLLGFIMSHPGSRSVAWLGARPLVWLGDVSYSFYVYSMSLQILIAAGMLSLLHARPGHGLATVLTLGIAAGTVSAALAMAAISHRLAELPSIAMGQRWSGGRRPLADAQQPRLS
jgi:peptidoglycan/LPS O-acetylase OafA/YrhL